MSETSKTTSIARNLKSKRNGNVDVRISKVNPKKRKVKVRKVVNNGRKMISSEEGELDGDTTETDDNSCKLTHNDYSCKMI